MRDCPCQLRTINRVCLRIYIYKYWDSASVRNSQSRSDESVGSSNNFVTGANVTSSQSQLQGRRARIYPDGILGLTESSEFLLEEGDVSAKNEICSVQHFHNRLVDLFRDGGVLSCQVNEGHCGHILPNRHHCSP